MKNLSTRRTIRQYSNQEVSQELLNRLLAEASRTQTMGNLQLYSVVVTRSDEMKQKLAPAHFNQPMVTQAPVVDDMRGLQPHVDMGTLQECGTWL